MHDVADQAQADVYKNAAQPTTAGRVVFMRLIDAQRAEFVDYSPNKTIVKIRGSGALLTRSVRTSTGSAALIGDILTCPTAWLPVDVCSLRR